MIFVQGADLTNSEYSKGCQFMWVLSTMQIGVRTHRKKDPKDGEAARLARAKIARKEEKEQESKSTGL